MITNKKAQTTTISMTFIVLITFTILSGLILVLGLGLFYIFYDYAIDPFVTVSNTLGISPAAKLSISNLSTTYLTLASFFDYFFLFWFLSTFIYTLYAANRIEKLNVFTGFGLLTFGNILLIFLLSYAVTTRDWIINEIFYKILTIGVNIPITQFFLDNTYTIALIWFALIVSFATFNIFDIVRDYFGFNNQNLDNTNLNQPQELIDTEIRQ